MPFPEAIREYLPGYSSTGENHKTSSKADVYFYHHPTKPGLFVKRLALDDAQNEADLYTEKVAMDWLQEKLKVPRVVAYHKEDGIEYLVTTQLSGWDATTPQAKEDIPQLIELLAQGLCQIHALPFEDCPLDCRVEPGLARIEQMISDGVFGLQDFPEAIRKANPKESLELIRQQQPAFEELVFTHGDYCLPNVLVQTNRLTGFIDWGYAGIGDRYRDFVSADYSIRRNLGAEWVPHFWRAYGIDQVAQEKLAFYQLLHDII